MFSWRGAILSVCAGLVIACGTAMAGGAAKTMSGLPSLPGKGVPKPSGAVGGLKVLDWAGF